jgi:hypothetical protein
VITKLSYRWRFVLGHELIRACGVVPRLSLFQILKNTQEDKFANVPHSHSSITHLLPSQCKILGRSRWFFCGLVLPSILWRIQGALLATEVSVLLSKKIIRSECRSQSLLRMMETHVHPQHSTVETSTLHFDSPLSTMALPPTNMMLTGDDIPTSDVEYIDLCNVNVNMMCEL